MRRSAVFFCLLTLTALLTPCHARVFMRSGSKYDSLIESAGGKKSYSSSITVNEGRASLSVFKFPLSMAETAKAFSSLFKNLSFNSTGGTMCFGAMETDDICIRVLLIQLGLKDETIVFKIEQPEEDYRQSKTTPSRHMLSAIPEFPGSKPVFFAHNSDTDMSLAVSSTRSTENAVRQFYKTSLAADGWAPMFGEVSSAGVFLRGAEVCMVMVSGAGSDGSARITLLHKKHGMK